MQLSPPPPPVPAPEPRARIDRLVREHFAFVWRILRRLGLGEGEADDAAQQVFLIAARRADDIEPARERAFLFTTAMHVASKAHRSRQRRREVMTGDWDEPEGARRDSAPGPEELLDRRRARELLDSILDELPVDLRIVFVLYEVEELTMSEIAEALALPPGTVASRLRRARAEFSARVQRIEARMKRCGAPGGQP
jgi:RNA polymerase sigma-70 factor, ECF subfamily